jgi:hypothetical protein
MIERCEGAGEAVPQYLEELPFSSVQQFARATYRPTTNVCRRISERLGFAARHLHWVPHHLSDDQKAARVQCSQSLLAILRIKYCDRGESWFNCLTDHELI